MPTSIKRDVSSLSIRICSIIILNGSRILVIRILERNKRRDACTVKGTGIFLS